MVVLGEGNRKKQLIEKFEQLNLQDHFQVLGDRSDIYRFYQAMDLFLLPSLFEGLPIVMIEAQVSGLPCVVTDTISSESDISGNVEFVSLIEKNKWGEVINKKLKDSNANRELMSAKLRDSDFDISHEALRLESILTDINHLNSL
jgi:glycosyltransferase involved in cell wall biosynthesis